MKKAAPFNLRIGFLSAAAILLAVAACPEAMAAGSEVLAKLGLSGPAAKEGVLEALASGNAHDDAAFRAFKALPASARAGIVRAGLEWIKAYAESAEFAAAYRELREKNKPQPPAARPAADDELGEMRAEMEKNIAEMRRNMAAMDAESRKAMEAAIQEMRAQMVRMESGEQKGRMRQAAAMAVSEDKKSDEDRLKEWEQRYPADPRLLIQRRIEEFLAASAGVDYAAKLVARGDQMVFASEEYEKKPAGWKLCFRAGREATEAARAFAKAWLAELGKN